MPFSLKLFMTYALLNASYFCHGAVINVPNPQIGTLHRRTYFYVGQVYAPAGSNAVNPSSIADGQMYVEHLVPEKVTQALPILFIHGHAMTGTNILNTPDGRPGWADYFLSKGYQLYIVDQPGRARSAYQSNYDGAQDVYDTFTVEERFTATQRIKAWPKAVLHTQWPGNGSVGDPVFDAFYAGSVPSIHSDLTASLKIRAAGVPLLDKIGPVILLTHSQSGPFGWVLGDAKPSQIKGIVSIEPVGPPFQNAGTLGTAAARPWGVTETPLSYNPPVPSPDFIQRTIVSQDSSLNFTCWQQVEPARKLISLAHVPVLMITSESGEHSNFDGCTASYLIQAGVSVKHVRLEDVGIHGNGHMMFMEKNSEEIVQKVVEPWIAEMSSK